MRCIYGFSYLVSVLYLTLRVYKYPQYFICSLFFFLDEKERKIASCPYLLFLKNRRTASLSCFSNFCFCIFYYFIGISESPSSICLDTKSNKKVKPWFLGGQNIFQYLKRSNSLRFAPLKQ